MPLERARDAVAAWTGSADLDEAQYVLLAITCAMVRKALVGDDAPATTARAVLGRELDGERRRSAGERRALAGELGVHEAGWRSAHRLAVGAEDVAARHTQRWRDSGDECKMLATRGLASVAQLREALGGGGERAQASVDAVERVLREVQGAWSAQ